MKRWDGAAHVDITVAKRWDGAAWVDLTVAKRWDGAAWVDVPLPGGGGSTLAITGPGNFDYVEAGEEPIRTITTPAINLTTSGGTGPYTYSWARLSGSSAILAQSPNIEDTQFTVNAYLNQLYVTTFRLTVTDSLGATSFHDVTVTILYETLE